jgi:penicillin amidase
MKILRTILVLLLVVVIIVVAGIAFLFNSWTQGPLPQHSGTIALEGLNEEVEIIRDEYGVPHIYASNSYDLFFAQGYTQAQDRWWQMEFFRNTGNGSIQELTGQNDSLLGTDIFIRAVGWRAAAERDFASYDEETIGYLQAFSDGVNAYIMNRSAGELAFEYNVLGVTGVSIEIEPWTPVDTLVWGKVMAWDLSGNQSAERTFSALIGELGEDMVEDYLPDYPFDAHTTIIQPEDLPESGETFAQSIANVWEEGITGIRTELAGNFDDSVGLAFAKGEGIGSNNWVVSGDKTVTGMPLLANDPHLGIQMPSIWYEIGLHCQPISDDCPFNVRGFTFAPAPGVIVGHNDNIAWGVTNVGWDTQDLYRMVINPDNDLQYEWNGEWRDMTVREEIIRFGDSDEALTLNIRETHLGPIINDYQIDDEGNVGGYNNDDPLALRWTALDTGTLFMAVARLNRATNWDEFRDALSYWDTPAQNVVYADIEGNIGYQTPSNVPIRANGHTGILPMDGTTDEFEWLGYVPYDYLPSVFNPERGYISTANQALVPLEYYDWLRGELGDEFGEDAHYTFGYYWAYGWRGQRIVDMLETTDEHSWETFQEIHGDNEFTAAGDLIEALSNVAFEDETYSDAVAWLGEWDLQMHMDSPQAALFGQWWMMLNEALYDDQLGDIASAGGRGSQMWSALLLLEDSDNIWWDDSNTESTETRDDILRTSFENAFDLMVNENSADRDTWRWGNLHTATFISNPLGLSGIDLIENMVNRGPVPTSGGDSIVNATGWSSDLTVRTVPSMRMIVDMSDFEKNLNIHTTGQSGHPFSTQYEDMIDAWRNIEYKPMLWNREGVENAGVATLTLQPSE